MFNFGQSTTTAGNTFGTTTPATGATSLFGGGDTTKSFAGGPAPASQDNKQSVFGGQPFGSFMFGAKTTAQTTSGLFAPATTAAAPAFGASKPLSFDFGSPPNQTVGSPAFGAIQQPQQQQTAPQNLSFGAPAQQQPALPTFGSAAQTTTSALQFGSPSFSFTKPATTSAFSFSTPTSGFSALQQPTTATTSTAPQTTQSFFSAAATTTANVAPAPAPAPTPARTLSISFGQSNFGGFAFTPTTAVASATSAQSQPTTTVTSSLTFSTPTSAVNTTAPPTFGYGQPNFSAPQATAATATTQATGLTISAATTSAEFTFGQKTSALSFATKTSTLGTTAPTLSLGTTVPAISLGTTAPALSLGTTAPAVSLGTTAPAVSLGTTAPAISLGTTPSLSTGLSFPKPTTAPAISSAASTTAPSGITALGKTTATTTMASLTTATTTTAAAPPQAITSITFAQLEENINKWTQELEEQEKTFINQATQLNAWDRLLIANGEKIVELNDAVQTVKNEQESLEHELGFVLAQQRELEELLTPMEKQLLGDQGDRLRDPEREHMYFLAENLETQLRQMSEDLKEVIEHLNETNRSQDSNDPIVQIGRILNAHMSSMQWIDNSIAQISTKLDQLKATHDTLRRDNERSFQKTYN